MCVCVREREKERERAQSMEGQRCPTRFLMTLHCHHGQGVERVMQVRGKDP